MVWANSADNKLMIFFIFSQKIGFDISGKLSPRETICMKCQSLFSWEKSEKYFKKLSAEIFTNNAVLMELEKKPKKQQKKKTGTMFYIQSFFNPLTPKFLKWTFSSIKFGHVQCC